MHDRTITLFNYHEKSGVWYPLVLSNISLNAVKSNAVTADAGMLNADIVEAVIQVSEDKSVQDLHTGIIRKYAGPKEYAALENPDEYFTFTPEQDFFVEGNRAEIVDAPILDNDFNNGFYHAVNQEMDDVYMLTSAVFYSLIPHFEIGGH